MNKKKNIKPFYFNHFIYSFFKFQTTASGSLYLRIFLLWLKLRGLRVFNQCSVSAQYAWHTARSPNSRKYPVISATFHQPAALNVDTVFVKLSCSLGSPFALLSVQTASRFISLPPRRLVYALVLARYL